eukprot:TRINITY_DN3045_c0_g1_i1.p1 TRINITY_DN3045_c0_g1~~TRINITY_DN3045_c0_g1_i1.p1  ORF type:complete len:220 (-),score=48.81 TRINITY_DN3045_c0_g1_i1:22-681(-)
MPKSKRNRVISLTKVDKKIRGDKEKIVNELHEYLENYSSVYLFEIENMRNNKLKELRLNWTSDSRFFLGKNSLMEIALGRTPETEAKQNIHKLTKMISGECGLLFTNKTKDQVLKFFEEYNEEDYARGGFEPEETIILPQGPLIGPFSHAQEPYLRKLGLPTSLQEGVINLTTQYCLCKAGQAITVEQAKLLKLMDMKMAKFRIQLRAVWQNDQVTTLQ